MNLSILVVQSSRSIEELQKDLDQCLAYYNKKRPHSGRYCYGKTPWQTLLDSIPLALAKERLIDSSQLVFEDGAVFSPAGAYCKKAVEGKTRVENHKEIFNNFEPNLKDSL